MAPLVPLDKRHMQKDDKKTNQTYRIILQYNPTGIT